MNIKKALTKETVLLALSGTAKNEVIAELLDFLLAAHHLTLLDRDRALQALYAREAKMSTGMENGVAIPHAKIADVDRMYAVLGIKKDGVDFDALDGKPSQIFVMTLSPADRAGPHIQFLAEISQILNNAAIREKLLAATSEEDVLLLI
ncbi:MAG: PTS sugar transporter subunit IIA [Spartobacteria bacterium]|nr:PTS sugar transporter subunit IIA [Spartobacteria bacterium]